MRFQDSRRDGRAVVYAAIQAEPLVAARREPLAADATRAERILARRGDERETDRSDGWRRMFPTTVRARRRRMRYAPGRQAILALSLEVADRGEQVRSQVRGAIVEALTSAILARRGLDPATIRASDGSCSTACQPRSIRTT